MKAKKLLFSVCAILLLLLLLYYIIILQCYYHYDHHHYYYKPYTSFTLILTPLTNSNPHQLLQVGQELYRIFKCKNENSGLSIAPPTGACQKGLYEYVKSKCAKFCVG